MKLIRRPRFIADLEEGADYLQTEAGEVVVARWREAIKRTARLLQQFPELGRLRSDLPLQNIRTLNLKGFSNWLVFYRAGKDSVELLRVKHGMMNLPELF